MLNYPQKNGNPELIPLELLQLPGEIVEFPHVETRPTELPFDKLTWQNFERLLFRLASKDEDVEQCMLYGRNGQAQEGIDIFSRLRSGLYSCWQAKNYNKFTRTDISSAVDRFLEGSWAPKSERFVLCVRASLADTHLQLEIESQAIRLRTENIIFQVFDGSQLSEKLRMHPDLIDDFFGRNWLIAFAGQEVADTLRRRLDASRVIALSGKLANIYDSRFRQLDPGLNLDSDILLSSDVRERFVSPDVDIVSHSYDQFFDQIRLDNTNDNIDLPSLDEDDFSLLTVETSEFNTYEVAISPRLALEEWLLQGRRSLLLGGAGSGKSTVLRCLALDLVSKPRVFIQAAAQLIPRIPILIPFALWAKLTEKLGREVSLAEVVRETFRAHVSIEEIEESFIESLYDKRLLLLIDGLDEYSNEQAARLALATLESFIEMHDVITIATARPAGLRRLGVLAGDWQSGRLAELTLSQQRNLAEQLFSVNLGASADNGHLDLTIGSRVDSFFIQLERTGRLQSLAGTPLLLKGLLSVAYRNMILPRTRFHLFEELISLLLNVHPNRRATAAIEVQPRTRAFINEDIRHEALSYLAFEIQKIAADSGIGKAEARKIIEGFLLDVDTYGWTREQARLGASELINVDANTSGLLVETGPGEVAFCHASFREHLAGLELSRWPLGHQQQFVRDNSGDPRWRGAILSLLQSLRRQSDVQSILGSIKQGSNDNGSTTDQRLLLADAVFAISDKTGSLGMEVATSVFDTIETGRHEGERFELLNIILDGPRTGPIGEEISKRLQCWWPRLMRWRSGTYHALGNWPIVPDLERVLMRGLHDDDADNRFAAGAALAKLFGGNTRVSSILITFLESTSSSGIFAAILDALIRGWPETSYINGLVADGVKSRSADIRAVSVLTLYRGGWHTDEAREALLDFIYGYNRSLLATTLSTQVVDCLVTTWAKDSELQEACWAAVLRISPDRRNIDYQLAQNILLRIHHSDQRVAKWVADSFYESERGIFGGMNNIEELLAAVIIANPELSSLVDKWFIDEKYRSHDYHVARLAAVLKSNAAKDAMLRELGKRDRLDFWPVWSLLTGWGMVDKDVSVALTNLLKLPPAELQRIAHHLPAIVGDEKTCYQILMNICELPELQRPDFVIRAFAHIGCAPNNVDVVSAVIKHVPARQGIETGVTDLIKWFYGDSRVRDFAIQRLYQRTHCLETIAEIYKDDPEIRALVLRRCSPLPTGLRRNIARRASQRFDDEPLYKVLMECDLEDDGNAKILATIGLSRSILTDPAVRESHLSLLVQQLVAIGPDMDERRAAALGGLLVSKRIDLFAKLTETHNKEPLKIDLSSIRSDFSPVAELVAANWDEIEPILGEFGLSRFIRYGSSNESSIWPSLTPYINKSTKLSARFVEYCRESKETLDSSSLLALSRIQPHSTLLLDCCVQVLKRGQNTRGVSPLEHERTVIAASKCLSKMFHDDPVALSAICDAINKFNNLGAFVGLGSGWPNHDLLQQYWQIIIRTENPEIPSWCSYMSIVSTQGDVSTFTSAVLNFITRPHISLWDFSTEVLNAIMARVDRDPDVCLVLEQAAMKQDSPDIRASIPKIFSHSPSNRERARSLALILLDEESSRQDRKRFSLDITANRIRRVVDVLNEVTRC